jgi:hypothetical protein
MVGEHDCIPDWLETTLVVTLVALLFIPLAALYLSWSIYLGSAGLMVSVVCLAYIIPRLLRRRERM